MLLGFDSIYIHFDLEWMDVDKLILKYINLMF